MVSWKVLAVAGGVIAIGIAIVGVIAGSASAASAEVTGGLNNILKTGSAAVGSVTTVITDPSSLKNIYSSAAVPAGTTLGSTSVTTTPNALGGLNTVATQAIKYPNQVWQTLTETSTQIAANTFNVSITASNPGATAQLPNTSVAGQQVGSNTQVQTNGLAFHTYNQATGQSSPVVVAPVDVSIASNTNSKAVVVAPGNVPNNVSEVDPSAAKYVYVNPLNGTTYYYG